MIVAAVGAKLILIVIYHPGNYLLLLWLQIIYLHLPIDYGQPLFFWLSRGWPSQSMSLQLMNPNLTILSKIASSTSLVTKLLVETETGMVAVYAFTLKLLLTL